MNDCLLRQALFAVKEKYVVLFDKDDIKDLCLNSENLLSMLRAKIEEVKLSSGLPAGTKADTWEAAAKRHRRQRHERDEQSEKIHRA